MKQMTSSMGALAGKVVCKNVSWKERTWSCLAIAKHQCGWNTEWGLKVSERGMINSDQRPESCLHIYLEGSEKSLNCFTQIRKITQFQCGEQIGGTRLEAGR